MAHNLVRAAGALARPPFAKARAATIRRDLVAVAARTAWHGRGHITLHLPEAWHREQEWLNLLGAACGPPASEPTNRGQAAEQASGRIPAPGFTSENSSYRNRHPTCRN